MSDIVERLRKDAELSLDGCGFAELVELEREAADEIERLRSELDACGACIKRADAEIERLRQETLVQSEAIETLRGLLLDARDDVSARANGDGKPAEIDSALALLQAIDEALGE